MSDSDQWIKWNDNVDAGDIVQVIIEHWNTKGTNEIILKKVDESDCDWRFTDDDSELSYDWNVTHWKPEK